MSQQGLPDVNSILVNPEGWPHVPELPIHLAELPTITEWTRYVDTMYRPHQITSDWVGYRYFLQKTRPDLAPRVLLMGHDMSEIENITLMALGGIVQAMNGTPRYLLVGPSTIQKTNAYMDEARPDWLAVSLYTGLTSYFFEWIRTYKIDRARAVTRKPIQSFDEADRVLKGLVKEAGGPIKRGSETLYAPVIIGGHYNNYNFLESWQRGGDFVVRGKGINLLRDILLGLYPPGIYHDPMPYANIPRMDRETFYADTFAFSDATKKYALSPIKSIITALGCSYGCTYCYISSIVNNLKDAYKNTGIKPPDIIQDRELNIVVMEGEDIVRLDQVYGAKTRAVFDQADISLNNIAWWEELRERWLQRVGLPFYIQARPGMLAGEMGRKRIDVISQRKLVAGISMAIESGDPNIRKYLLNRHEPNSTILNAIQNVKEFKLPLRTQAIVALPVLKPTQPVDPTKSTLSLVSRKGEEFYYDDPLQESLKCLDLVCQSHFAKEDYYWNSLYSPFPGTPLGDYAVAAGFADDQTDAHAYQFTMDSGLKCFTGLLLQRQVAFSQTSNFFAHFVNGKDLMSQFLHGRERFALEDFAEFVSGNSSRFIAKPDVNGFGILPEYSVSSLHDFFQMAYVAPEDQAFYDWNLKLTEYYRSMIDGLVLAAKVACRYFEDKAQGKVFELPTLYRVERLHYYDNSYHMAYIPKRYEEFFERFNHHVSVRTAEKRGSVAVANNVAEGEFRTSDLVGEVDHAS